MPDLDAVAGQPSRVAALAGRPARLAKPSPIVFDRCPIDFLNLALNVGVMIGHGTGIAHRIEGPHKKSRAPTPERRRRAAGFQGQRRAGRSPPAPTPPACFNGPSSPSGRSEERRVETERAGTRRS